MIHDTTLDKFISEKMIEQNAKESAEHKPSGKLSASMLGSPLQWQILKSLATERGEIDEYTLRKFQRGKDVENWILQYLPTAERQKFIEYRGVVGYADAIQDTSSWTNNVGTIPLEVKSVTNAKYARIMKQGADRGHKLQAGLYALALKAKHFAVVYVASDDYRVLTYIYETKEVAKEIDAVITRYDEQKASGIVPVFDPPEKWMANPMYNNYPEWSDLTQDEINAKLESLKVEIN